MGVILNKIISAAESKLLEYKQINELEKENEELELVIKEFKDNEFIYNPSIPNHNTPFAFIDFEKIHTITVREHLVIARSKYETYTLGMKSDEYFFEFIKKLIPVGEKTLVGKERLIMNHNRYNFDISLQEEVDIKKIKTLLYQVHGEPEFKPKETIVYNAIIDDNSLEKRKQRMQKRYDGTIDIIDSKVYYKGNNI